MSRLKVYYGGETASQELNMLVQKRLAELQPAAKPNMNPCGNLAEKRQS